VPFLLVLPFFIHAAAPGAIGSLVNSFGTQGGEGFIEGFYGREGESGSGRLADLDPAFALWANSPIVGLGIDNPRIATSGTDTLSATPTQAPVVPLIFDNQYLHTLVTLGLAGLIAFSWFIWGTAVRLVRRAKREIGPYGDLMAACGIACAGYGAGMFFYDSLAFIQVTLLLFIAAALGLRTMALADANPAPRPEPTA
jgi:O-antigen ligase